MWASWSPKEGAGKEAIEVCMVRTLLLSNTIEGMAAGARNLEAWVYEPWSQLFLQQSPVAFYIKDPLFFKEL